jgi:hypothetical protein
MERFGYFKPWNDQQATELQLTEPGLKTLVELSNGFSFAYLKELCLAAQMAWMNAGNSVSMDVIAKGQAEILAVQMRSQPSPADEPAAPMTRQQRFRKLLDGEA